MSQFSAAREHKADYLHSRTFCDQTRPTESRRLICHWVPSNSTIGASNSKTNHLTGGWHLPITSLCVGISAHSLILSGKPIFCCYLRHPPSPSSCPVVGVLMPSNERPSSFYCRQPQNWSLPTRVRLAGPLSQCLDSWSLCSFCNFVYSITVGSSLD